MSQPSAAVLKVQKLSAFTATGDDKLRKHNLFETERFFLDVYCLRPGQEQKPHAHAGSDKVYLVLEGACVVSVGEAEATLEPGDAVLAPAGESHGVRNPGPEDARLLVWMSPPPSR